MRVSKNKSTKFGDIKPGTPFYLCNVDCGDNILFMKTGVFWSSTDAYMVQKRCNAVNIENGNIETFGDEVSIVVANAHVEDD